jgi:hypothetical protein
MPAEQQFQQSRYEGQSTQVIQTATSNVMNIPRGPVLKAKGGIITVEAFVNFRVELEVYRNKFHYGLHIAEDTGLTILSPVTLFIFSTQ